MPIFSGMWTLTYRAHSPWIFQTKVPGVGCLCLADSICTYILTEVSRDFWAVDTKNHLSYGRHDLNRYITCVYYLYRSPDSFNMIVQHNLALLWDWGSLWRGACVCWSCLVTSIPVKNLGKKWTYFNHLWSCFWFPGESHSLFSWLSQQLHDINWYTVHF